MEYKEQLYRVVDSAVNVWHEDGMKYWDLVEWLLCDCKVLDVLKFDEDEKPIMFYEVLNSVLSDGGYEVTR